MTTDRFTYEGRHLREWLLQLVVEEPERRRKASKVIMEQLHAPMELLVDKGVPYEVLDKEFKEAVRKVVNDPAFPAAEYVQKLLCLGIVLERVRLEKMDAEFKADDQWHEEQSKTLGERPTQKEFDRYMTRAFLRVMRQHKRSRRAQGDEALETGFGIMRVVDCLGVELLSAAEQIRSMLKSRSLESMASDILCRMGPAAMEFYPDMKAGLNLEQLNDRHSRPLGLLLRYFPEKLPEVFEFTESGDRQVQHNAIKALGYCGREAVRSYPEVEAKALRCLNEGTEWHTWAWMLGEVAVTSEAVTALLDATNPEDYNRAATAIDSLGQIGLDAERVVPRLIQLLDEFKELDPDWSYEGEHLRIAEALKKFGAAGKTAIPALIRQAWTEPETHRKHGGDRVTRREPDEAVIKLLGAFGGDAREALPLLLEMKAEVMRRGLEEITEANDGKPPEKPEECCPDYVLEAIARIGGRQ